MTELKGIKWNRFFLDLLKSDGLKSRSLQWGISESLRNQGYGVFNTKNDGEFFIEFKECKFCAEVPNYYHIFSVYKDYPIELVRKEDTVLDLGANIGAFSIPVGKICSSVIAVEPVTWWLLKKNSMLNRLEEKIKVFKAGIGEGVDNTYTFNGQISFAQSLSYSDLKDIIGTRVDYIKVDIEGDEWLIDPSEFKGTRVITGEVHLTRNNRWKNWLRWFESNGYKVKVTGSWNKEKRFTACLA